MNTQSIYTSFVGKVLVLIVLALFAWGNVLGAEPVIYDGGHTFTRNEEIKGGVYIVKSGNASTTGDLTISGSSTVLFIEGDLFLNGDLHIKDNATLIVNRRIVTNSLFNGIYVRANSSIAVLGFKDQNNTISSGSATNYVVLLIHKNNDFSYVNSNDAYVYGTSYSSDIAFNKAKDFITENSGLLPIELTSCTALQTAEEIEIAWTTNSEVNNDYFTVEYSIDGVSFKTLETVAGSGTTSEVNEYAITTESSRFNGVVYFRLKQTDYNGEYSYSDVITLAVESSNELYVYPNPATEFVSVSGTYKTAIVQDMFGKKVACATNGEQIFVGNLSVGTYYIVVATENGKKVLPFVKE